MADDHEYRPEVLKQFRALLQDWSRQGHAHGRHVSFKQEDRFHMPITARLGGGGFGEVLKTYVPYKYRDGERKTYLARKQISMARTDEDEDPREVFHREISILRRLRHQHVIEFVGSYEQEFQFYALFWPVAPFTLEHVLVQAKLAGIALNKAVKAPDGLNFETTLGDLPREISGPLKNLAKFLTDGTRLEDMDKAVKPESLTIRGVVGETVRRLFGAFGCLAEALRYLSVHTVRHRDLKPENILMYPSKDTNHDQGDNDPNLGGLCGFPIKDGIRISDFGLAKGHGYGNESYYMTRTVAGTQCYNAPEEILNETSGPEADIFSLGCVFLEILCALSIEHVEFPALKICSRDDLGAQRFGSYAQYLKHCEDKKEDGFNDWTVTLHASGESVVQDHLISLIKEMMSNEPRNRPTPTQITTRLAMMEQLRKEGLNENGRGLGTAHHPLFGSCCPPVEFVREDFRLLQQIFTNPEGGAVPVNPSRRDDLAVATRTTGTPDTMVARADLAPTISAGLDRTKAVRYRIQRNAAGERIDPVPPHFKTYQEAYARVKNLQLCRNYYLQENCRWGDECQYTHDYPATPEDLVALSHNAKYNQVCTFGTDCIDVTCVFGHNCPNSRDPRLLTTIKGCYFEGPAVKCRYPARLHDLDTRVVSDMGEPEELIRTVDLFG